MTIKHAILATLALLGVLVVVTIAAFLRDAEPRPTGRLVGNLLCYGLAGIWLGYFLGRKTDDANRA